jgi:hypothetical protein
MPTFLLKKTVDRSLLTDGSSIPLEFQPLVHSLYESPIAPGEKRKIKIIIEEEGFDATLINSNFNRETFASDTVLWKIAPCIKVSRHIPVLFQLYILQKCVVCLRIIGNRYVFLKT